MGRSTSTPVRSMTIGEGLLSRVLRILPVKHGKHRLLDRLCRRAWKRDVLLVWVPFSGERLRISIDELVGWHFAMLRSFDPEVVDVLLASGSDIEEVVFWDIGANKGACSYAIARGLVNAKIVAIEPQSALEADNRYNLDQLCRDRYHYVRAGIGEREETLNLVIPAQNTGRASLHMSGAGDDGKVEAIEVVKADRVVTESGWGWPDLVKIDVEGHESVVIASLRNGLVEKKIKVIVFECHARDRAQFDEIRQVIDGLGYSLYGIDKSILSTRLRRSDEIADGMTDYVILLDRFREESSSLKRLLN